MAYSDYESVEPASDIQEEVLNLPSAKVGQNANSERQLRSIAAEPDWRI